MKKKIISALLIAVLVVSAVAVCVSCKDEETAPERTRMTVDINPSVEFMLDSDAKVVSVTALNDDGSIIIAGEAFVGMSAEEAAKLVVSLSVETGYIIDNDVNITVSGDTTFAENLRKNVETVAKDYLASVDVSAAVNVAEGIKIDALRALTLSVTTYTEDEVKNMSEDELYAALSVSRVETALMLTEDMRNAYYQAKDYEISFAEREETAAIINGLGGLYTLVYTGYKAAVDTYSAAITAVDDFRYDNLVDPDCEYQK